MQSNFFTPWLHKANIKLSPLNSPKLGNLREALVTRRERVIAISGNNATGKTLLWQELLQRHRNEMRGRVEVVSCRHSPKLLPQFDTDTALIVFDDLQYENFKAWLEPIQALLAQNPSRQVLLVSCFPEFLEQFNPSTHIRLKHIGLAEVRKALSQWATSTETEFNIERAVEYCQGDARLISALLMELSSNRGDIDSALRSITNGIDYSLSKSGILIPEKKKEWLEFTSSIQTVNSDLLRRVKLNPESVFDLSPRQFEEITAEIMERRGYKVELTKATRDGGKDLIIANHADFGNFVFYLECKRFSPNRPVGVNLVRQLAGSVHADRVTAGILVTSSYFSPDAITFSEQLQHQMSLVDFLQLRVWLKQLN